MNTEAWLNTSRSSPPTSNRENKLRSLPILDSIIVQLEAAFGRLINASSDDVYTESKPTLESSDLFLLKPLFLQTLSIFTNTKAPATVIPIITREDLNPTTTIQQRTIFRANRLSFALALTDEDGEVPVLELHDSFRGAFAADDRRLGTCEEMYLDMKTQVAISAMLNSRCSLDSFIQDLFKDLFETEEPRGHIFATALSKKQEIMAAGLTANGVLELALKYRWVDFRNSLLSYIVCSSREEPRPSLSIALDSSGATTDNVSSERHVLESQPITNDTASTFHRVASQPYTRWQSAEQDALMAGLEEAGGPYWARILALHGKGGSRSEMLKNKNQGQLKDKARNIKLAYVRSGAAIPEYLQDVTGKALRRKQP